MIYYMIFSLLINLSMQSTRIRTKESYTTNYEIEHDTIKMAHKKQTVYVLNLTNAYDVDVFGDSVDPIQTPFLSLDNKDVELLEVKNQCVGFPKHPQLKEILQYKIKDATEDSYYTDMVTLSEYSNLFLITQELVLIQIKLRCSDSGWIAQESQSVFDLKKQLNLVNPKIKTNAQFSCPKKHLNCLIVTPYGGFWVSKFSDFDSKDIPIEPYPEQNILKRKVVHKVSTFGEYLVVAVGTDGVDLYTYEQEHQDIYKRSILHILTISKQQFNVTINIIGVKIQNDKLFCLDDTQGLFIFNISNVNKPILIMDIHIPRTVAFEVYENTVLVVAQTPNNIEYIMEIFIDLRDHSYFVNRVLVDDFTYRDLQINPNYAFLIGEEAHLIIKHSIFNGFVKYNKELVRTFFENQLVRFELYSKSSEPEEQRFKETFYYVGLSRQAIHVWKFMDYHAFLLCSFDERSEHEIIVKLNSTSCDENIKRETLYQQCQADQKINVLVSGPLFYSDTLTILVFILFFLGFVLCIICICVCVRWKRLLKELEENRYQLKEMKKYGYLPEQEQNQI
ncbi:unnamed protein product [Paramecium pentaurelia]|uniref:Transmembrane protein n=1 Tax=Paramecium pentaurelia TaxID=43138 RepID=A0A8S1TEJ9_9CILI|nr:unnamed protein product [Paramecium pentaurelia]